MKLSGIMDEERQQRSLVTGGAGFIGSHLAEALLARSERVVVIDDLSTGRLDNIAHLMEQNPRTLKSLNLS